MKTIFKRLASDEKIKECMHPYDLQINEAMNMAVNKYARKGRTYCTTMSLTNRVMIAMGVHNEGYSKFWTRVFESLALDMSPALKHHLEQKDAVKSRKRKYEALPARKKKRARYQYEKMHKELRKQIDDAKKGKTYGTGIALETEDNLPAFVVENDRTDKKLSSQRCPFVGCFGKNHRTTFSKECAYNGCGSKDELVLEKKNYLRRRYPDQYGKYKNILKFQKHCISKLTFVEIYSIFHTTIYILL